MALADPEQILGLSPFATDPVQSRIAEEARRYRRLSGAAEDVLVLRPDMVLAGRFTKRATRDLLKAQGLRVVELEAPRSLDEAKRQIGEVAALVGHPERGARVVAAIAGAEAKARRDPARDGRSIMAVQRRGWVAGGASLAGSVIGTLGLRNAGDGVSRRIGAFAGLETIVSLRPDLLLVPEDAGVADDQGSALLRHPALLGRYPPERRLTIPGRLLDCGGPGLVEALDRLADQVGRTD